MTTMELIEHRAQDAEGKLIAMAVGVLLERVMRLDERDREDFFELAGALRGAQTQDEWRAAQEAMVEILDQREVRARPMDLRGTGRRAGLQKWVAYVSGRIRALRKERGWTQVDLAAKSGLPQSHISRIENGQHSPSHVTVEKIARALKVVPGELDPSA